MKEIKLSFPYPSTSRHNLSQDVGTSLSMGLVIPVRTVEVLAGDSHRIGTSFSLISNPLVKPLLQGVNMRYCRFWVPRRIYHMDQRMNNSDYDVMDSPVRHATAPGLYFPAIKDAQDHPIYLSNVGQSSLWDYLGYGRIGANFISDAPPERFPSDETTLPPNSGSTMYYLSNFNAEPYIAYIDICRNYFGDSANDMIAFSWLTSTSYVNSSPGVCVASLKQVDGYIDAIQNSRGRVSPFNIAKVYSTENPESAFFLPRDDQFDNSMPFSVTDSYFDRVFTTPHFGLCVPLNRPDRLSRLFDTRPLASQNAVISPTEISIGNLSFLSKLQRFLTRRFFGGSRFTDVMYSVFGQKVPHVDSPVLLDVFDYEIGSELVASTNATSAQNPGVLGGFFSASGNLTTGHGSYKRRYSFNEPGYIMDLVYIMPRLFRTAFVPDYYFISSNATQAVDVPMLQANFIPDFNGIGWQQPVQTSGYINANISSEGAMSVSRTQGFCCEPSWQQYRTLPDICSGAMNPLNYVFGSETIYGVGTLQSTTTINSPLFTFCDRMRPSNILHSVAAYSGGVGSSELPRALLARMAYSDFNNLNAVFGMNYLSVDNIFAVFRYAHQAKRQVSKRFTLTFA